MSVGRGNEEVRIPIPKPSPVLSPALVPTTRPTSQLVQRLCAEGVPQPSFPVCSSLREAAEVYHREYLRLFAQNQEANRKLAEVISERNQLADRYNHLKRAKGSEDYVKRRRREAKDIAREFFCPIEKCKKGYGSEGSLTHHVRLKHKEYFDSGSYEIFLQRFLEQMARQKEGRQEKQRERQDGKGKPEGRDEVKVKEQEPQVQIIVPNVPQRRESRSRAAKK